MAGCCGSPRTALLPNSAEQVREGVRARYAEAARRVTTGVASGCCGAGADCADPISSDLYEADETGALPARAVQASLGCGNPTALAELHEGEIVLDLGSGGGIDVLLTARRVGPSGKAYGLDMTDEMLALARENQREAGIANAEFLKGRIEEVPLPDASVDVIISNCVINLSPEKDQVLAEAQRVLRPGGRLAISDIVFHTEPSREVRRAMNLWGSCIGGALTEAEYRGKLAGAGFVDVDIEFTREYDPDELDDLPGALNGDAKPSLGAAFVRARKPD